MFMNKNLMMKKLMSEYQCVDMMLEMKWYIRT